MKAIEIRAALIAANDMNLNGADALVETAILKQLIESCKARVEELDDEAKTLAAVILSEKGADKGKFEHEGHTYTLDREVVYNILTDTKKYNYTEAATYRALAREQTALRAQIASRTKKMKAIYDAIPSDHPRLKADDEKFTLKCLN